jgi:hypothetical protein
MALATQVKEGSGTRVKEGAREAFRELGRAFLGNPTRPTWYVDRGEPEGPEFDQLNRAPKLSAEQELAIQAVGREIRAVYRHADREELKSAGRELSDLIDARLRSA